MLIKRYKTSHDHGAQRKLKLVLEFARYRALEANLPKSFSRAAEDFAKKRNIPGSTFRRWCNYYWNFGVEGLRDRRGGGASNKKSITPQAFELLQKLYLSSNRLPLSLCFNFIHEFQSEAQHLGWRQKTSVGVR